MIAPFVRHRGTAVPLQRANIDTDMVIRIDRLVLVPRRELGAFAFEMLRLRADGSPDPDCILNHPRYQGASILVAGRNFGCGSSREAAVWALAGSGIRCVIAPSFGDIFRQNCVKNGILPVVLGEAECSALQAGLLDAAMAPELEIDLEALRITLPDGGALAFAIQAFERNQLLTGEDEVTTTLRQRDLILAHLARWEEQEPWNRLSFPGPAGDGQEERTS
jgi:3-isopropylmalate/(R)-2-methylmalate dehydratase small subunit